MEEVNMFNMVVRFLFLGFSVALVGCASVQKDYDHMAAPDYQKRQQLHQSLISASEPLSETAVQKILSSKVVLPKAINLAIVRLSDSSSELDFQTIDQEIADKFYNKANWGGRVQSITPVPQVMLAKPVTITTLRQAAVLLQADALLIIKPVSYGDSKFQWFEKDKAKGITSLEVLLLDTRTSVVPFTQVVTETAEIAKDKDNDYSNYELISRAKKASEAKALLQVPSAIQKFISKTM